MNIIRNIILLFLFLSHISCVSYEVDKSRNTKDKKFYSSNGFALVYDDSFFEKGIVSKRLNTDEIAIMHSLLKKDTPVKIINPENSLVVEARVLKKANYSKLFNVVVSKKIAQILELDTNNPYVEVIEIKKNKTFIAKEGNIFEEEKKVATTVRMNEIKIDDLTETKNSNKKKLKKKNNFIIVISDFYYYDSANNLKQKLFEQTQINNFLVKKINDNKYRLLVGPFKNFDALKSSYISLNNLGFEELNIYRE